MKVLRTALAAAAAAGTLLVASPANAVGIVIVQGESASSWSSGCGDGGDLFDAGPVGAAMFFPASGCYADYTTSAESLNAATFWTSGQAGTICGTLTVAGSTTTASESFCVTNDTPTTIALDPLAVSANGRYRVTWTTGSGTPSYCNLWLDFLAGIDV